MPLIISGTGGSVKLTGTGGGLSMTGAGGGGGGGGGGFDPTNLSGLKVWYKSDAIVGATNNQPLSAWNDSSGNGKNLSVPSGRTSPYYFTGGINGKPYVKFGGLPGISTGFETMSVSNAGLPQGSTARTVYYVVKTQNSSDPQGYILSYGDTNVNAGHVGIAAGGSYANVFISNGQASGGTFGPVASGTTLVGVWAYTAGGSGADVTFNVNGVDKPGGNQWLTPNTSGDNLVLGQVVGYTGGTPNGYFTGDIYEVLIYNSTHDATARGQVLGYLNTKYGI